MYLYIELLFYCLCITGQFFGFNSSRQNLYSDSDINFSFSKKSSNDSSVLYKLSSDVLISPITFPFLFAPHYLHGTFFYKLFSFKLESIINCEQSLYKKPYC